MGPRCSSAETQVCHRSYIIAANDVPTLKNFYRSPFSNWPPQCRTNSTLSDFNDISYVSRLWCPELTPDIEKFLPVAIFKMATTIRTNSTLFDFNKILYIGRLWWPELIPDIEQFLPVSIFKMATTIPQKIQHCSISKVAFDLFFKPVVSGRFGRLETS